MNEDDEFSHLISLNYKVPKTAEILGIGRDQVYKLLEDGKLEAVKVGLLGAGTRVTRKSIIQYQKALPKYEPKNEARRDHFGKLNKKKRKADAA